MPLPYPSPPPRTNQVQVQTRQFQSYILKRRKDGASFPKIAEELDRTQGYVYKLYKNAMRDIIAEDVESVRKMELLRLDSLIEEAMRVVASFTPMVSGGTVVRDVMDDETGQPIMDLRTNRPVTTRLEDKQLKLAAMMTVSKLMERKAKLLGLDAPAKTSFTDPSGKLEAAAGSGGVVFYIPDNGRDGSNTKLVQEDVTDVTAKT